MTYHAACTRCHAWITTPVARDAHGQPLCETCAVEHGAPPVDGDHRTGLYWVAGETLARERRAEEDERAPVEPVCYPLHPDSDLPF
jgi:hypothetical protein